MPVFSTLDFFPSMSSIEIIDIGAAYIETSVYDGLLGSGRARLTGFEPDKSAREDLERRYGAPHRFYPHFVGAGGPATFHETNMALTGSLFEPNTALLEKFQNLAEVVTPKAQWPVDTVRLDDVTGIDALDFLKIDVQGAELMVFEGAPALMSECLVVQTEVEFLELYKGQPLFADIDRHLRKLGFQFHTFDGFSGRAFKPLARNNDINSPIRQLLWTDAIYVRDWLQLDKLSNEKLAKLAVLAHDMLKSWDLCHLVLQALDARPSSARKGLASTYMEKILPAR